MKKKLSLLLAIMMLFTMIAFAGCSTTEEEVPGGETPGIQTPGDETPGDETPGDETPGTGKEPEEEVKNLADPVQVVIDNHFTRGFNVKGQQDGIGTVFGKLTYDDPTVKPAWSLGQWYCGYFHSPVEKPKRNEDYAPEFNILNAETNEHGATKTENNGLWVFKDASKTLRVNPSTGMVYAKLEGTKEYTSARKDNEPWPHLLLEYGMESGIKLDELDSLTLNLDYTLKAFSGDMGASLKSDIHCAQFPFYCVVSNRNTESKDYGRYIWFGACLFDNRQDFTMTFASADIGSDEKLATGAFIYQVGQRAYLDAPVAKGELIEIKWNMLPFMKTAFETAQRNGYLKNTKFEDLYATGGNMGWEVTGTYDAALQIDKFEIMAVKDLDKAAK